MNLKNSFEFPFKKQIFSLDTSLKDEKGHNQGFKTSCANTIRTNRRAKAIHDVLNIRHHDETILEIGCGTGDLAAYLATHSQGQIYGIDQSEKFLTMAKENHGHLKNLHFIKHTFSQTQSQTNPLALKANAIVGNGILHHLYYFLDESLSYFYDQLQPNGKIVFWEPNLLNPYVYFIFSYPKFRQWAHLEKDEMAFTQSFIESRLRKAKFKNIKVECKDFLLPNTPSSLVKLVIDLGAQLEKNNLLSQWAQSLFIYAEK
jgi:protein-L-isoaspartate O-methyltransferase